MAFFNQNTAIRCCSICQTTAQVIFTAFVSLAAIILAVQSVRSRSFSSRANDLLTCGGLTMNVHQNVVLTWWAFHGFLTARA
jgi:hypothetical protein